MVGRPDSARRVAALDIPVIHLVLGVKGWVVLDAAVVHADVPFAAWAAPVVGFGACDGGVSERGSAERDGCGEQGCPGNTAQTCGNGGGAGERNGSSFVALQVTRGPDLPRPRIAASTSKQTLVTRSHL